MTASCPKKPNIAEISPHLICALCGGYLIDATTIVECLHSFCKTCIVRYLESSKYCPICEVLVHKTRPLQNIRLDHTLQNIVYKLVPGLFQDEMKRRREFYKDSPTVRSAQARQEQQRHRIIYSADEKFSVCMELCPDGKIRKPSSRGRRHSKSEATDRRYLLCPANTTVALLKKFMKLKFFLNEKFKIDIFHSDGNLRDHYQLMDVAYIYSYKRDGVLHLYYSVQKIPTPTPKIEIYEIKREKNALRDTGSSVQNESESKRIPNMDDNRPSSLFSKASLLSNHRIDGNIEHDLSPLELIATVANDLSSYQEGRGLKRKPEETHLFETEEETSNSKEIQIQKSIEHAIDICAPNGNHGNIELLDNKTPTQEMAKVKTNSRTMSPAVPNESSQKAPTCSKQKCIKTTPNLFDNLSNKIPVKEKPKTTDTASQCEPRPKKQKLNSVSIANSSTHSKSPIKVSKCPQLPHIQQKPPIQQTLQANAVTANNKLEQVKKPEPVPNHVIDKSKSPDDHQKLDRTKIHSNNNNVVEHNGAINKVGDAKPKESVVETDRIVETVPKTVSVSHNMSSSTMISQKTSVIKSNNMDSVKHVGNPIPGQTNGFTNIAKSNVNMEKQTHVVRPKQSDKD